MFGQVPNEMIMSPVVRIVQCDIYQVVSYKAAVDKWIIKVIYWHHKVIDLQLFVEVDFTYLDLQCVSGYLSESPHFEYSIINKHDSIKFPAIILFDLLELNICPLEALFKFHFIGLKVIHLDKVLLIVFLGDGNSPGAVIGDDHGHDRVHGDHALLLDQILKHIRIVLHFGIRLNAELLAKSVHVLYVHTIWCLGVQVTYFPVVALIVIVVL